MYYLGWLVLILVGVGLGIWAFVWALGSGQFSEQDRARFLPLRGEGAWTEGKAVSKRSLEPYFFVLVAGLVALSMVAVIWISLHTI
ncbi:MAG: cbb3-type cytochrome oxidase assembly protein [Thermodesulfobacteriota bacterium]